MEHKKQVETDEGKPIRRFNDSTIPRSLDCKFVMKTWSGHLDLKKIVHGWQSM